MSDIDEITLRQLDLMVLLVFLGMMRHRKAVTVAGQMGLTQSSISHALKRLRGVFGDPLFLRKPHGMEPTALARALEPQVREAVEVLNAALRTGAGFDPTTATTVLRIGTYDNEMAVLVPGLLDRLARLAPGLRLVVRSVGRDAALQALDRGEIDLALGYFWSLGEGYLAEPLYDESYLVVARAGHPGVTDQGWTLEAYAAAAHLLVSPAGGLRGIVDDELARVGQSRRVVASVPLFFPALATVAESDLIATLPARLVRAYAPRFGLSAHPAPVAIRKFTISAVRHRRNLKSGLHDWLQAQISDVAMQTQSAAG
ncbi:MAG: LysR family transcriptional regulator [Paracoccaceae bacterium]